MRGTAWSSQRVIGVSEATVCWLRLPFAAAITNATMPRSGSSQLRGGAGSSPVRLLLRRWKVGGPVITAVWVGESGEIRSLSDCL